MDFKLENVSCLICGEKAQKPFLSEVKDRLSEYLHEAENEAVIITRHGKPAGLLIGFASEDDWIDYRLENDPRFLARISKARESILSGKGIPMGEVFEENEE